MLESVLGAGFLMARDGAVLQRFGLYGNSGSARAPLLRTPPREVNAICDRHYPLDMEEMNFRGCPEIDDRLLAEAADPSTASARLSEMLRLCDAPRIEFAARRGYPEIEGEAREQALEQLAGALRHPTRLALSERLAKHPKLDPALWIRALEISPASAVRNPLLKSLLVEGRPLLASEGDLLAVGRLAEHCLENPADTHAQSVLAELICMGLPQIERFGAMYLDIEPEALERHGLAMNPYGRGDAEWTSRGLSLHLIGNHVVDALERTGVERAREALLACERLGRQLVSVCDSWKIHCHVGHFSPAGEQRFTETLLMCAHEDWEHEEQAVVGWRQDDSWGWIDRRPGFFRGRVHDSALGAPRQLRSIVKHGWIMNTAGDFDGRADWSVQVSDEDEGPRRVKMIARGVAEQTVELKGCSMSRKFPAREIARLEALFGAGSWAVLFAKNPAAALCTECGELSGYLVPTPGQPSECDSCGYERSDEEAVGDEMDEGIDYEI